MTGRKWTLLLLADDREKRKELNLGPRGMRLLAGGAGFFGIALLATLGWIGFGAVEAHRSAQLAQENALLAAELAEMRSRVEGLQGTMESLVERDAEVRSLAGLDPVDGEVLQVGVGGPGTPSLATFPLYEVNEEVGARAFEASWDLHALERRARLLRESLSDAAETLERRRDLVDSTPSILPVEGRISSYFSNARFHPIHQRMTAHNGIDIPAPVGTPIRAAARGRVIAAGRQSGFGLRVEIDHGHGFTTLYAHASRLLVRVGQEVERGEIIAQVGATGTATTPHLHYEVRRHQRPVDPMDFLFGSSLP